MRAFSLLCYCGGQLYVLHMSEVNDRRSYDSDNVIIYGHNIRHEQFGFGRKVIGSKSVSVA